MEARNPVKELIDLEYTRISSSIDMYYNKYFYYMDLLEDLKKQPEVNEIDPRIAEYKEKVQYYGNKYSQAVAELRAFEEYLNSYSDKQHLSNHQGNNEYSFYATGEEGKVHHVPYEDFKREYFNKMNSKLNDISPLNKSEKSEEMRKAARSYFSYRERENQRRAEEQKQLENEPQKAKEGISK